MATSLTRNELSLFRACIDGDVQKVKELLKAKTNIDCQHETGATPLYLAAELNHTEVVNLLLSSGAKADLALKDGTTPLFVAAQKSFGEGIKLLLSAGANVDLARDDGTTPLFIAVHKNFGEGIKLLLSAGANVDLARDTGATPLFIAAQENSVDAVKLLLSAGANVDLAMHVGATPLHVAAQNNCADVVELLLSAGANVDLATNDGGSPLDYARSKGHEKIVDMLQTAMLNPPQKPAKPLQVSTPKEGATGRDMPRSQQAPPPPSPDKVSQSPTVVRSQSQVTESTGPSAESGVSTAPKQSPIIDMKEVEMGCVIGQGGYGAVYEAKWKAKKGMKIAVKVCPGNLLTNLPREVHILTTLPRHPNVVSFFGVALSMDKISTCIITELAQNGSLYDYLYKKKEVPSLDRSLAWALQVAYGMEHLHAHDIIHRDLKSHNVLLSRDLSAKVCDFGTARTLTKTTTQTKEAGTYRWMAPEIMAEADARINKKCDLFSYGMVMYEMLAHQIPYSDIPGSGMVAVKVLEGKRPAIPPSLPLYIKSLLQACWKHEPNQRPTFGDVVLALQTESFD